MISKVYSGTTIGLEGVLIEVEVDVASRGFPTFNLVGLPDKAIEEAKDRVRTAIINASFDMPDSRITVNLAPADIPKQGSSFDLPIAVGILAASGMISPDILSSSLFIGELSLQGTLREVSGVISILEMAKKKMIKQVFLPIQNANESSLIDGITIYPVSTIHQVILHANGDVILTPQPPFDEKTLCKNVSYSVDFADIQGQNQAKRALEIASAGFHNIHLRGVPGAGKTMLSRAFPSILPLMDKKEIIEVTSIYSITGHIHNKGFMMQRPFRSPHHTTSRNGLIGGGSNPVPGEISLAHRGVLFLDELPEFPRSVLESLRQPLEDGVVHISRASGTVQFPSRFLLLAASNPCPCGYLGHPTRKCHCMPGNVIRYKKRLSGPLLDRIDLHVDVPPVNQEDLMRPASAESSDAVRKRVEAARTIQRHRFIHATFKTNGEMNAKDIHTYCSLQNEANTLMKQAISTFSLSARSYFKLIKIAQTIADLDNKPSICPHHVAEALQYRVKQDDYISN